MKKVNMVLGTNQDMLEANADCATISDNALEQHMVANHTFPCDQCTLLFQSSGNLKEQSGNHYNKQHLNDIDCRYCDFKSMNKQIMFDHIECDHIEFALLASVVSNQADSKDNFEQFKGELTSILIE